MIEIEGIACQKMMHTGVERKVSGLDEKMKVIPHQAIGEDGDRMAGIGPDQEVLEVLEVLLSCGGGRKYLRSALSPIVPNIASLKTRVKTVIARRT